MKILDFIICDDIRHEITGKQTFVGVFTDLKILYDADKKQEPLRFKLAFFLRFKKEDKDEKINNFEVLFKAEGKNIHDIKGTLNIPPDSHFFNLVIVDNGFPIPIVKQIDFEIIFKDNEKIISKLKPEYHLKLDFKKK